jgi:hypothetical protein
MAADPDITDITDMSVVVATCLLFFDEADDEDDMLKVLLSDRKRRRRFFDTSRLYTPAAVPGNVAEAIWSSSDVRFAEQVRLSRLQFLHVRAAVEERLSGPPAGSGRRCTLTAHEQLLIFLYHIAQCKCLHVIRSAVHQYLSDLSADGLAFFLRHPVASTVGDVWHLACNSAAYSCARVRRYSDNTSS